MADQQTGSLFARAVKDPLVHFVILGGLLFALSLFFGNPAPDEGKKIVISQAGQRHLANLFEITWQRPPTAVELANLVQEQIKEEIYYREALTLGLDDNDTIVRRRMRQKLEFMQEDLISQVRPSEEQLRAFFESRSDQYFSDRIMTFQQVLLDSAPLAPDDPAIAQALAALENGTDPAQISRSALLPVSMKLETANTIANTFGAKFVEQLTDRPLGHWSGPIVSSFGTHLVLVQLDQVPLARSFAEVKEQVKIDYVQAQRQKSAEAYYKSLRDQYQISIEAPKS
jgi:hypothetical protein